MRLKSFATYGFKSFADKTELTFDKGITAVVGPNGSGKSNISDAIRWVLGEQSAKYLRGTKMEDVIFSGSSKRRALGVAEVTVNFDNTDHTLPLDFDEVSLTRRIYRSGDSDYAINKKNCRLKDIVDLMADTGLGKGSMSIIGQNKIDEILNSRPEDRRALFEEAAGIAKYRLRKKEATRRLDDTAQNLTRINDIRTEVDNQVAPLQVAAEKTRQFNELNTQLVHCRLTSLIRRLDTLQEASKALTERKQHLDDELTEHTAQLGTKQAAAAQVQQELDKLAEAYNKLQEDIKDKETEIERLRGQKGVLEERIAQSQRGQVRAEERNTKLSAQADELEKNMNSLAKEFDQLDKLRAAAELTVNQLNAHREEQVEAIAAAKGESEAAQSKFFDDMQELMKLQNELHTLEQEQDQYMRQREILKRSIATAEESVAHLSNEYAEVLDQQARCQQNAALLKKQADGLTVQFNEVRAKVQAIAGSQQQCQRQLTAAETKEQSLQRMQASYEGFGFGIKNVMRAQTPWRKGVVGVVAELVKVEGSYVTAIETALGEGAQNIVTHDAATAKAAIAFLKQNNGGRGTFLPLDTVQKRMPTAEEAKLAKLPGVCGYAVDLVQFPAELEKAMGFLLGRVLVAENIDAALKAAKAGRYRLRVVTLEGDTVNAGGSMSGGSRKHKEGYLSRSKEIEEAAALVAKLHGEMLDWQEQLEEQEEIANGLQKKLQQLHADEQQQNIKITQLGLRSEQLGKNKAREEEAMSALIEERSGVNAAYMANRDKVKELRTQVQSREAQDSEAKTLLEGLNKKIAALGSELTATDNRLQDARVELETSTAKTGFVSERIKALDADTLRVREEIKTNQEEHDNLAQVITDCQTQISTLEEQSTQLMAALEEIVGGKDKYAEDRGRLVAEQQSLEAEARTLQSRVNGTEERLRKLELDLARQQSDYEHVVEQLASDYQLDEVSARLEDISEYEDLDDKALQKRESSLALRIADLGPVNPAAIEEYEAVKERSEFLRKQYEDLCEAKENLESVIGQINTGMTKKFKEAFTKINEYFASCYVKLFGGGTAVLALSNPDDVLNSGIDINVQPPGKKLQSLYLMSGGERALTVIALLFALLSYQPSPFCILDEIDAALDDANIARFAGFLRSYSGNTQFIIITHRKGTMECADIMYGVTMEESGVSKLLSVKINAKE